MKTKKNMSSMMLASLIKNKRLTTDLDVLEISPIRFTWGILLKLHTIGEYCIGEYHPWKVQGSRVLTGEVNEAKTKFHCWLKGKDLCTCTYSLDEALLHCMADKYEGCNNQFAHYAMRMLQGK